MKYVYELKKLMRTEKTSSFEHVCPFFEKLIAETSPKVKAQYFGDGIIYFQKMYGNNIWASNWMFYLGYAQALQDYKINTQKKKR